jgi:type I restriction enzyme, S subunit
MVSDAWQTAKLEEICVQITDGKHGDCQDEPNSGYYFLSCKDVFDGKLNYSDARQITEADFLETHRRTRFAPSDILITNSGTIGRMAVAPDSELTRRTTFQKSVAILKPIASRVEPRFLYYALQFDIRRLIEFAGGTAQKNLLLRDLRGFEVSIPPPSVQRCILAILSAYDDLIENNLRRIRILEEMARSIYREWFVHFRFPGHEKVRLVDSSLGPVPEGWILTKLCEIAENFDRFRKPLSKMQRAEMQGDYPYYGAAKVFDYVNDYIFDGEYLLMAEDGSVITTERAPVLQLVDEKFWPNNHTHILRGKPPVSTHFLYLGLYLIDISPYITGAAQPKITQENMNRIPFVRGTAEVHQAFDNLVSPMIHQVQVLRRQTANLGGARDLLLPRLLSGTIDISDAVDPRSFSSETGTPDEPVSETLKRLDTITIAAKESPLTEQALSAAVSTGMSPDRLAHEDRGNQLELGYKIPPPIDQSDRSDVLAMIRQVFSDGRLRTREDAIRDVARALDYGRVGHRIQDVLHTDLVTAVRRGILENAGGELRLLFRSIADYDREFLKRQFLGAIGLYQTGSMEGKKLNECGLSIGKIH